MRIVSMKNGDKWWCGMQFTCVSCNCLLELADGDVKDVAEGVIQFRCGQCGVMNDSAQTDEITLQSPTRPVQDTNA